MSACLCVCVCVWGCKWLYVCVMKCGCIRILASELERQLKMEPITCRQTVSLGKHLPRSKSQISCAKVRSKVLESFYSFFHSLTITISYYFYFEERRTGAPECVFSSSLSLSLSLSPIHTDTNTQTIRKLKRRESNFFPPRRLWNGPNVYSFAKC